MTATTNPTDRCLPAETLAAFVDGNLPRRDIEQVVAHLDHCRACREVVAAASEVRPQTARNPLWFAVAAAIALILLGIPFLRRGTNDDSPTSRLVSLAPTSARVAEPRLSGGFPWAPYRGPVRSGEGTVDAQRMKLMGAAGEIVEQGDKDASPDAKQAAGVALVLIEQPLEAVERLRAATTKAPNDAAAWSDLSAAQYAAALRLGRASLYPEALASADKALRIDANLPEALFNRALVLERLGLADAAREAWQKYLQADRDSAWATEARERLSKLPKETAQSRFRSELPRLERAAAAGDHASVDAIVDRYRQQSRTFAEGDYLGRWGAAELAGNAEEATKLLAVTRAVGRSLTKISGESLLDDTVKLIDAADPPRRAALAAASVAYRQGRITYSKRQPSAAEPELRHAAKQFLETGSPMAYLARYYASNARFDRNDVDGAQKELDALRSELDALPRFPAAGALVRWELALCRMTDGAWSEALPTLAEAADTFRRLGERGNLGFVEAMRGDALHCLGRPDEAWLARVEAYDLLAAEGFGDRMQVSLSGAARMELRSGRLDVARALLDLEIAGLRAAANDVVLSNALVRRSVLDAQLGDDALADRDLREAVAVAERITDQSVRARALTDVRFAEGATAVNANPQRAREVLATAIAEYRAHEAPLFLADCYLLRAAASRRVGDLEEAARDIDQGIAELERHPLRVGGPILGTWLFDATAVYHEAVVLWLDRGDTARAFEYAERSRAQLGAAATLAVLRKRLSGSGVAVLETVVLPAETITFALTAEELTATRRPIAREQVTALARNADSEEAAAKIYDLVIRPAEPLLKRARAAVIVPDIRLASVPYAALRPSPNEPYLIERMPVAIAVSASSLQAAAPRKTPQSIVGIALPSGEGEKSVALPETAGELADLGALYPKANAFAGNEMTLAAFRRAAAGADVIHLAGHTERQEGVGEAALVFAGDGERASWRTVAAMPPGEPSTVVLAACETLRTPQAPRAFAMSLGGGFLAAGAGDVIGTLAVVPDNDARELFRDVHRALAAGAGALEAVRGAQLAALRGNRPVAWRAVTVLTRQIPRIGT